MRWEGSTAQLKPV
jgi:hypothetical protein